jgi:hypothetical protein
MSTVTGQDLRKAKRALSVVAGALFWAWLLLAVCMPAIRHAKELTDAQSWPAAEATILATGVQDLCSRNGAHSFTVQYGYDVDARHFLGDRFAMFAANCYPDAQIAALRNQLRAGAKVPVRFNPRSPGESALSVDGDLALARSQAFAATLFFVVYSALAVACYRFVRLR